MKIREKFTCPLEAAHGAPAKLKDMADAEFAEQRFPFTDE